MSNIFVTNIVGSGTYAVPSTDAALASATSGLDTLIDAIANLDYSRVLAWVETEDGGSASRTLNCMIEQFSYVGEECPDSTETEALTLAIYNKLMSDGDISAVGSQQVHIFAAGAYFLWSRNAASGYLYPTTTTDDVAVGAGPNGMWFNDGDLVIGAAAMSGTEKLRVVGTTYLEQNVGLGNAPTSGAGYFRLFVRDATNDTDGSYGVGSELSLSGSNTKAGWSAFRVDDIAVTSPAEIDSDVHGFYINSPSGTGTISGDIYGIYIGAMNTGPVSGSAFGIYQAGGSDDNYFAGNVGLNDATPSYPLDCAGEARVTTNLGVGIAPQTGYRLYISTDTADAGTLQGARAYVSTTGDIGGWVGFSAYMVVNAGHTVTSAYGFYVNTPAVDATGAITDFYGLRIDGSDAQVVDVYAIHISDQSAASGNTYGIYQLGASEINYFNGSVGIKDNTPSYPLDVNGQLRATGDSSIGGTPSAGIKLRITTASSGGTITGGLADVFTTGNITTWLGFRSDPDIDTFTVTTVYDFYADAPAFSGGGSATNFYGLFVEGATSDITNAYGVHISDQAAATLNYGVYQAGSGDDNYFAGNVGIKDATPSYPLDVTGETQITGNTGIGGAPVASQRLTVHTETTSGAQLIGVRARVNSTENIAGWVGFDSYMVVNSGDTVTNAMQFYVETPSVAGAITNFYGFRMDGSDAQITDVYAIYIADQSTASGNTYGIYQLGASEINYFNGSVGIKDATPSYELDVSGQIRVTGNSSIGGTPLADSKLQIRSASSGATVVAGIADVFTTNNITTWIGLRSLAYADNYTISTVYNFYADAPTISNGGAVTNFYGLFIEPTTSDVQNAYGVYISNLASSPGTIYGVYQAGGAYNYFGGYVGLNDATPSYELDVNGDINVQSGNVYRFAGAAGYSGTHDVYNNATSGQITSITFAGGIVTSVSVVP